LPPEVALINELRLSDYFLPALSLVAVNSEADVVGHVLCTRGRVDSAPVLAALFGECRLSLFLRRFQPAPVFFDEID
jgi:putative acetyltransferase